MAFAPLILLAISTAFWFYTDKNSDTGLRFVSTLAITFSAVLCFYMIAVLFVGYERMFQHRNFTRAIELTQIHGSSTVAEAVDRATKKSSARHLFSYGNTIEIQQALEDLASTKHKANGEQGVAPNP